MGKDDSQKKNDNSPNEDLLKPVLSPMRDIRESEDKPEKPVPPQMKSINDFAEHSSKGTNIIIKNDRE